MTMMESHEIDCPNCGNKQKTDVWFTVNVTNNPDLKDELFDGKINMFSCAECEQKSLINVPLMYHDMDRIYCVQYFPPGSMEDHNFFSRFADDGSILMSEYLPGFIIKLNKYMTQTHIVFDMGEMIRYIVFRDRLFENINSGQ
jgi:hypothetical protein